MGEPKSPVLPLHHRVVPYRQLHFNSRPRDGVGNDRETRRPGDKENLPVTRFFQGHCAESPPVLCVTVCDGEGKLFQLHRQIDADEPDFRR